MTIKTFLDMENTYKRTSRHPSDLTKKKISQALMHRAKTDSHKEAISRGIKAYWQNDDNFPQDKEENANTGSFRVMRQK